MAAQRAHSVVHIKSAEGNRSCNPSREVAESFIAHMRRRRIDRDEIMVTEGVPAMRKHPGTWPEPTRRPDVSKDMSSIRLMEWTRDDGVTVELTHLCGSPESFCVSTDSHTQSDYDSVEYFDGETEARSRFNELAWSS